MGYPTGERRGETLGLTWDRVDLKDRWIYLDAAYTEDQGPRRIPINSELLEMLKSIPLRLAEAGDDRHAFQFQGEPFKAAKIEYCRFKREGSIFNDLRHTFTTNLRRAGVPEPEIMAITGQSSRSTFDRYNGCSWTENEQPSELIDQEVI